jgi:hypothetical protein
VIHDTLKYLDPVDFIHRFAMMWRVLVLCGDEKERDKWLQKTMSVKHQFRQRFGRKIKKHHSVYRDDDLQLHMKLYQLSPDSMKEQAVEAAFNYYVVVQILLENLTDPNSELAADSKLRLQRWGELWMTRDQSKEACVLGAHEAAPFLKYFGSIEVVDRAGKLVRLYFPIPRECREQADNPLVKQAKLDLIEQVKRDR